MPMLQYMSTHKPVINEEWQAAVLIAVAVIGIIAIIAVAVGTRKW